MSVYSGQVNRIVRVPLDGASSQTVFRGSISNWDGGFVSPDGRYVLNVPFGDRSNTLFITRRDNGRQSEVRFADGKSAWVRTVGYSADGRLAYVHVSQYDKVTPERLYSVKLETGEKHLVAEVDLHLADRPSMTSWPWTRFVVLDKDDQLTWAHVELTYQNGVDNGVATIPNGTSLRQFKFQTMIGRPMDLDIHWLPARRWLSISSTDSTLSTLVDTRSEETRSDYVYFPFQGKELAVYAQQDIEGYRILNKARKQLGVLGGAGWASERSLTFSRDGRWAAAYVDVSPRVSNPSARTSWHPIQGEIWIWDLSPLFDTDAESAVSPANDR